MESTWYGSVTWFRGVAAPRQKIHQETGVISVHCKRYLFVAAEKRCKLDGCLVEHGSQKGEIWLTLGAGQKPQPMGDSCSIVLQEDSQVDAFMQLCRKCAVGSNVSMAMWTGPTVAGRPIPSPAGRPIPSPNRTMNLLGHPGPRELALRWCAPTPDFGGRIAEYLWSCTASRSCFQHNIKRQRVLPGIDLLHLLQSSHNVQVAVVLGIKERRAFFGQTDNLLSLTNALQIGKHQLNEATLQWDKPWKTRPTHIDHLTQQQVDSIAYYTQEVATLQTQVEKVRERVKRRLDFNAICEAVRSYIPCDWSKLRPLQASKTEEEDYKIACDVLSRHMMA